MIKGVIFDLDSTLVDSVETIWKCSDHVLRENGFKGVDRETAKRAMGLTIFYLFDLAEPGLSKAQKQKLFNDYRGSYMEYVGYSKLLPYARESLEYAKSIGLKLALVTTKSRMNAGKILKSFRLLDFFDAILGYEDTLEHKPSAEPMLKASLALNLKPKEMAVIGDTEMDVRAGKGAGSITVAVTTGVKTAEQLQAERPDYIIATLFELPKILSGLVSVD
ncbi:MAG: HAD-IA family hydrolase [Candidatus Methanomethylicaceae archaeon]